MNKMRGGKLRKERGRRDIQTRVSAGLRGRETLQPSSGSRVAGNRVEKRDTDVKEAGWLG